MAIFSYIKELNKREQFFEKTSIALLIILLAITPVVYSIVPEQVLILKSKAGALQNYNSKSALWLFPLVGVIIYLAISIQKHYLIKYREQPAKGEEPEHTTTVWILRLVKMIAMAGLIISVLEVLVTANSGKPLAMAATVLEVIIVAAVFTLTLREVIAKYSVKK